MGDKQHWNNRYGGSAPEQLTWFQSTPERSLSLIRSRSEPQDAIIDVGAGASTLADALLEANYSRLTLLDLSDEALNQAKQRLGQRAQKATWIQADITDWRPPQTYQVWHDRAVFHFLVNDKERLAYRRALFAGLRPGGTFVIGTFAQGGPEKCSGLPIRQYDRAGLEEFLGPELSCLESFNEPHHTPTGATQLFHWAVFEKLT